YKAPKTLRFSRMDVVEDRGMPPPKGDDGLDNPPKGDDTPPTPPKGDIDTDNPPTNPKTDIEGETGGKGGIIEEDTPTTSTDFKPQAKELYTQAKEQERGFKELLEGLTQPSSVLEAGNVLKSVGSIESKLERKQGRVESLNDLLRGAIIAQNRDAIDDQLAQIAIKLRDAQIPHTIEYKDYRASGYEGVHIHFKHNDIPAEIQVHTLKSWENKKAQDGNYHIMREQQVNPTLTKEEWERLSAESRALGQDSDLDINLFTSFEVISTESGSAASLNLLKSEKDLNLTHILRLKSNSKTPSSPGADMAYSRPDSVLNQKDEIATGGKGIEDTDIQTPSSKDTTTPLKIEANPAFGENFAEYAGKGAEAVKKLLQEKRGQVSGAFYREDLGYIDLVWGDLQEGVGLSKILEKHIEDFKEFAGTNPQEKLINGIAEITQKGIAINKDGVNTIWLKKGNGYYLVGLSKGWKGKGNNQWIITSYKKVRGDIPEELKGDSANLAAYSAKFDPTLTSVDEPVSSTKDTSTSGLKQVESEKTPKTARAKDLTKGADNLPLNSKPDSTTTPLKGKSRLQQALEAQQAELEAKEAQLKAKALEDKENAAKWQAKLAQITQEKQALADLKDNDRLLQVGASVPMQRLEVKSSVSLDDDHIYPLDYAILKASDLKPNFTSNTGTQMRMQTDRARVEQIANAFDPQKVFLRGGFDDLPIVLQDGQVLAGNHRAQGMLEFSPESRAKYAQAVLEHYKVQLKPDELLVRVVANALNSKELLNLAMASNIERASTQGDKFLSALGKYDAQITPENLKHLDLKASSVEDMALRVAKFLDQQAKSPDIEKTNLALLGYSARNNADFGLSRVLDHAQNILSTEDFMAFKNAFIHNAGTFYNLLNNPHFPKLNLGPHLTRAMDATAKELAKDTRAENLKELIGNIEHLLSVTDPSLKATLKMNPTLFEDTLAQVLGVGFARFMRLENPDKHLFEFLQNVPKALQQELSETLFDKLNGIVQKPLEEANVYDFAKLLLKSGQITQDISKVANDLLDPLEARAKAFKSPSLTEPKETMQIVNEAKREGKSIKETRELLEENKDHIAGLLPYKKDNTDALMKAGKEAHLNGAQMLTSLYMLDALKAKEVQARMLFKRAFSHTPLSYTPHFSPKVQEALQGRHIDITPQSFSQLELKSAKELSPWLKPTLEEPNALVKQNDGALIFVKDFGGFKLKAQIDNNNFLSLYRVQTFNKVPHTQEVLFSDLPEL
ncbi:hypothetical protein, partial [Helicobacter ailurogastricus]|uniref:putative barnase/colicin E5 family endoribonuclease n=1 Tax=Helicobacter ailurogastricus TaxID=1578720 RepID=UPI002555F976